MPYKIRHGKGRRPWKIMKGGKVVGSSTSRSSAAASIRARLAAEGRRR